MKVVASLKNNMRPLIVIKGNVIAFNKGPLELKKKECYYWGS